MNVWKEFVARVGDIGESRRFQKRVREEGCLVRSLASATGTEATPLDYRRRFIDIDRVEGEFDEERANALLEKKGSLGRVQFFAENDLKLAMDLIRDVRRTDNPLGRALAESHVRRIAFTGVELEARVKAGETVIVRGFDAKDKTPHFVHVGFNGEQIIDLSDGRMPQRFAPDGQFRGLILEKRKTS